MNITAPIIGLAGPSCSGKSTISTMVAQVMRGSLLNLDSYWIQGCHKPVVNGMVSFERPHQYDGLGMLDDILRQRQERPDVPVVIEGFLIFVYEELFRACTHRFFLDIDSDILIRRRQDRAMKMANGALSQSDRSWLANGPDEWQTFGRSQRDLAGITVLNARSNPYHLADIIVTSVQRTRGPGAPPSHVITASTDTTPIATP